MNPVATVILIACAIMTVVSASPFPSTATNALHFLNHARPLLTVARVFLQNAYAIVRLFYGSIVPFSFRIFLYTANGAAGKDDCAVHAAGALCGEVDAANEGSGIEEGVPPRGAGPGGRARRVVVAQRNEHGTIRHVGQVEVVHNTERDEDSGMDGGDDEEGHYARGRDGG
ncbi:hypothetical protein GGX14DRAFT_601152 [Mycena pura]|uniref:Uncharacterized protein n=1 Tax=Mycena pura TaxID=153505 RepID=A0AAD6XX86_9AGAR|nr:hypothetical protein GGX14DRAFT_601152 [Mycena pura]